MSGLWCDPFEQYPDTAHMLDGVYAAVGSNWSVSNTKPRTGTKSMHFLSSTDIVGGINGANTFRRIFGAPKAAVGVAHAIWLTNLPSTEACAAGGNNLAFCLFVWLTVAGAVQARVVVGTDGSLVAYGGGDMTTSNAGVTLLGRSFPCITAKAYHHVEAKIAVSTLGGTLEVRVDGVTRLNIAGANTNPQGTGEVSQLMVGCPTVQILENITGDTYLDDLHAWDTLGNSPTDFVGNASCLYRAPIQDTVIADWSIVGGVSAFPLLDDNLDSTYIAAPTVGQRSAFVFAPMPADVQGVIYQQLNWRALKVDSGDCDIMPGFISSAVEGDGPSTPVTAAEAWYWWVEPEDPATSGAPWTPASATASEGLFTRSL